MKFSHKFHYVIAAVLSLFSAVAMSAAVPDNLVWEDNMSEPVFASDKAKKGGTLRLYMDSFPPTFRVVGPNSNGEFRQYILGNQMTLTMLHPNSKKFIPQLATQWAVKDDFKTVYYKLDPAARWSDGQPVTADDFVFARDFYLNPNIKAPYYHDYFTNQLVDVTKYDDHTISISLKEPKEKQELIAATSISPVAKHFYDGKVGENWVRESNWEVAPTTGAYTLSHFKKGKSVTLTRNKEWWAKDLKFQQHRFNVDKIRIKVIRDRSIAYKHFLKGELDTFDMPEPIYWHEKTKTREFANGYIKKTLAYNDRPRIPWGLYLNTQAPLLSDLNIRLGLQHAVNMQKGIEKALRGDVERLPQFTSGNGEYQADIQAREFDLAKADEYFTKAGWGERNDVGIRTKDGQTLSITLMYTGDERNDLMVILREEAKKAGVDLVLNKVDFTTRIRTVGENKHQAYWGGWMVGVLSPTYWQFFHSVHVGQNNTNNTTNTANPELDKLIDAYRSEFDVPARIALAKQIQQLVHDQAFFIPGYQEATSRAAHWRWVHLPEVPITRMSRDMFRLEGTTAFGLFWIDDEEKKEVLRAKKKRIPFEPELKIDDTFKI